MAKVIVKTTQKRTQYLIANQHTADIIIPRLSEGVIHNSAKPLILPSGKVLVIEAEEWNKLRKNAGVKNYIDAGLIAETKREGDITVLADRTSDPVVPDHLLRDEEIGQQTDISAGVRRRGKKTITVE